MAELLDSGARRQFESGAVRDISDDKGRMDLVPLGVVADNLKDESLSRIEQYIRNGNTHDLWAAIEAFSGDKKEWDIYTALIETSKQYQDGAKKYSDRNWENGMPVHCFIDSGVRHYLKYLRGDTDEPHDRAFIWNMLGAIWTHENKPELIDLPFAEQGKAHRPTQAELEDLFSVDNQTNADKEVVPNVNYERMTDNELHSLVCLSFTYCNGGLPDGCPLHGKKRAHEELDCADFRKMYPEKFRKVAIEYLEGLDKQN